MSLKRVCGYVDGFNLYYGIREKGWKHLYWIDPFTLVESLVTGTVDLHTVKYFTARIRHPDEKRKRQSAYLDALRAFGDSQVVYGQLSPRRRSCRKCKTNWTSYEEKMTDSAIAAHLVADAFLDRFDTAIMVGGDTDIIPAIRIVRTHFPEKTILAWYPPRRKNDAVGNSCHGSDTINHDHLAKALMPDQVEVGEGIVVERPSQWTSSSK